jgi:O-succinylbenzoate synthase
LLPRDGFIDVRRVEPDEWLLDRYAADADRTAWWLERLDRCYRILNAAG